MYTFFWATLYIYIYIYKTKKYIYIFFVANTRKCVFAAHAEQNRACRELQMWFQNDTCCSMDVTKLSADVIACQECGL